MGTSKRERQEQRQATRRRGILIGLGIAAFLAFAIGYSVLTSDDDGGDDEVATVDDAETDGADGETATEDDGTTDTTEAT